MFFREENVKENVKQDLFLKIPLVKQNVIQVILLTMIKCANPAILRIVPNAILMVLLVSNVKIIHFFNNLFVKQNAMKDIIPTNKRNVKFVNILVKNVIPQMIVQNANQNEFFKMEFV